MHAHTSMLVCYCLLLEVKGQLMGADSPLPLCGSQESASGLMIAKLSDPVTTLKF